MRLWGSEWESTYIATVDCIWSYRKDPKARRFRAFQARNDIGCWDRDNASKSNNKGESELHVESRLWNGGGGGYWGIGSLKIKGFILIARIFLHLICGHWYRTTTAVLPLEHTRNTFDADQQNVYFCGAGSCRIQKYTYGPTWPSWVETSEVKTYDR